jgi:Tetracyclin repressor-like, C-terminal domain
MRAAVAEGSLRSDIDIDTAIDLLYGSLYYRLLLGAGALDERFIDSIYDQFLEGHRASALALDKVRARR